MTQHQRRLAILAEAIRHAGGDPETQTLRSTGRVTPYRLAGPRSREDLFNLVDGGYFVLVPKGQRLNVRCPDRQEATAVCRQRVLEAIRALGGDPATHILVTKDGRYVNAWGKKRLARAIQDGTVIIRPRGEKQ